jgi:hypothetical protein
MGQFQIDWNLVAVWAQAISSTVVLFMIYMQIKQVNDQIIQNDQHERFRRSWEFVKLYREELKSDDSKLVSIEDEFNPLVDTPDCKAFHEFWNHFFIPRFNLYILLNQLVANQEVDEKILYGYLEEDFNKFVEIGIRKYGLEDFKAKFGVKIKLLIQLWGSLIPSSRMLYGNPTGSHPKPVLNANAANGNATATTAMIENQTNG